MKPMGRPKKDNPKANQLTVRLDDETLKKLDESAEHFSESRVQTIRRGIEKVYSDIKK